MPVPGIEPCGTGITYCLRVLPPIEESEDTSLLKTTHKLSAKIWILNIIKRPADSNSTNEWWLLVLILPPPLYQLSPQTLSQPTLIWYKRGGRETKASNWKVKLQEEKVILTFEIVPLKIVICQKIIIPRFGGWQRGNLWQKAQTLKLCFPCVLAMTRSSRVVNCALGMLSRYLRLLWNWKLSDNQLNENGQWKCRDEENIPV